MVFGGEALDVNSLAPWFERFDDRQPGIDGLYLLEINTQPGMTPLSLVPDHMFG